MQHHRVRLKINTTSTKRTKIINFKVYNFALDSLKPVDYLFFGLLGRSDVSFLLRSSCKMQKKININSKSPPRGGATLVYFSPGLTRTINTHRIPRSRGCKNKTSLFHVYRSALSFFTGFRIRETDFYVYGAIVQALELASSFSRNDICEEISSQ